jgi:hypothetical protein
MKILNYILKTLRNPNPTRKKKLPFHLPIISNDHIINSFLYVRDFIYHIIILLELNYFLISARIKLLKTWIRLKKRKEKSSGTSINIINPTTSNTCFQIFIFFFLIYTWISRHWEINYMLNSYNITSRFSFLFFHLERMSYHSSNVGRMTRDYFLVSTFFLIFDLSNFMGSGI